jgi:hypothetical protein
MVSSTSWSEYFIVFTPPTISSSTCTPYGFLGMTSVTSSCGRDTPCTLFSTRDFFLPCGDEAPTYGIPSYIDPFSLSGSQPCGTEPVACFSCCGPLPLDASDFVLSASSSGFLTSCSGLCSSSTRMVFGSYSGVWISSTYTTDGTYSMPSCTTRSLSLMFLLAMLDAPTLGGTCC